MTMIMKLNLSPFSEKENMSDTTLVDSSSYFKDWSGPLSGAQLPPVDPTVEDDSDNIDSKYYIDYNREMGRGEDQGTVVRKAIDRKTGQRFAVKTISKRKNRLSSIQREIDLLMSIDHPNILKCHGSYEDAKSMHVVTEYCKGGELYRLLRQRGKSRTHQQPFSEPEAAHILQQIISAVAHCHSNGIVHRDLKLENILLTSHKGSKDSLQIKVIDFGLATRFPDSGKLLTETVGTSYYVAPEILEGLGYDQSCDVWSIGVIGFALLSGKPPFRGMTQEETFDAIQSQHLQFDHDDWHSVSGQAKKFLKACLCKDPKRRPSAQALLQKEWIQEQAHVFEESAGSKKHLFQKFKNALHYF